MSHISLFPPEGPTGLGPVTLPDSFRVLKGIANAAELNPTLLSELQGLLKDEGERRILGQLRGPAAEEVADFLDTLIRTKLQSHPEYRMRTLRVLRSLSGSWGVLPASYTLQGEVKVSEVRAWIGTGFSEVWRGILGSEMVAIKVIKVTGTSDPEKVKKLSKEAIIWKHLNHRNILPLYGVSTCIKLAGIDSNPCLISPWMENGDITAFVTSNLTFNRFELLVDVCEGLTYLHSEGFVHGDLKGDNVLIDSENKARLADFGFARVFSTPGVIGASISRETGGTLAYMAPELFKKPDDRSASTPKPPVDVFALGTLIYEVLSGRQPFHGQDPRIVKCAALDGLELGRPPWSIPDHAVWDMVERCRVVEPENRPKLTEILEFLAHASRDPPAEWPSPPTGNPSPSSWGSSLPPQLTSRATLLSIPLGLSLPPIIPNLQIIPQSLLRSTTVHLLGHQDGPALIRWKPMGDGTKEREPGLKKENTM